MDFSGQRQCQGCLADMFPGIGSLLPGPFRMFREFRVNLKPRESILPKPPEIFPESVNLQAALADHGSQIKSLHRT